MDSHTKNIKRHLEYWHLEKGDTAALMRIVESFMFDAEVPHWHLTRMARELEEAETSPSKVHELMELGSFDTFEELREYLMDCLKEDDSL